MSGDGREVFRSFSGTVLAMAGTAIGLGNIWRFPYMLGVFGGAGFLLVYFGCVLALGVPALMCEWTLGRTTRRGPVGAFENSGLAGGRFWGLLLGLGVLMVASYYVVVIGWVARYAAVYALRGGLTEAPAFEFQALTGSVPAQLVYVWLCLGASCAALYFGVRRGIERVSKAVMPVVLLVLLVLAVRALTLEGAWQKTLGYFANTQGFGPRTVLAALGQSIFSLALGGTSMVAYGSYMSAKHSVSRGAAWTAGLDTAASLLATLVIVPPALVFGADLRSGPGLLFEVMPSLFGAMPGGGIMAAVFLLATWLCAMLSLMAAYEVIVAGARDAWGWTRRRALGSLFGVQMVLTVPAMRSVDYIFFSDLLWGSTMQPVGAAVAVIALAWFLGLPPSFPGWLHYWIKHAVPLGIAAGLLYGWFG